MPNKENGRNMPNDEFIAQIEAVRDTISGRQRAVVALQNALQTVTQAQAKAQRSLRDLEARNSGIDIGAVQDEFAGARSRENAIDSLMPNLRREAKNLAAISTALKDASSALRAEPADVVRLEKARATLQAGTAAELAAILPELGRETELASRALGDEFGVRLRDQLAQQGIAIGGRAPRFEISRFELEANFAQRMAILRYGKDIVVPRIPITVEAVLKAYIGAARQVVARNSDGKAWIAQFYAAYENARRKNKLNSARVNIIDCYVEQVILRQSRAFSSEPSKRTFTDYSRAQFAYDFYEFAEHARLAHNGEVVKAHVATKSQTDRPTSSIWIVEGDSPYDGRYFADVEFVKE